MDRANRRRIKDVVAARNAVIRIRASRHQRERIDHAAHVLGMSRSAFVLEAACREAEEILLNQVHFSLTDEAFAEFTRMLDAPLEPSEALRTLMQS